MEENIQFLSHHIIYAGYGVSCSLVFVEKEVVRFWASDNDCTGAEAKPAFNAI